jgi:hypothetical protein
MSDKLIGEMDDAEFTRLMESYIDRPSLDDEIPVELVFAALDKTEQVRTGLELQSTLIGDRLVLSAPSRAVFPANVRELEINLPAVRVVVCLEPVAA